ncbi:MAG: PAS domain S-box protein [Candidatus Pacebacteria bacterium]|jgi:PAS domain S-box-containing protein|nr:PAS domain S-box protein [Candidatus Paceibacterota bacterium]
MYPNQKTKPVGRRALIAIAIVVIIFSIGISFFFARESERFFWEARTKSVAQEVAEVSDHVLKENYIARWTEASSTPHLQAFAQGIEREIPTIAAVRIFTTDAVVVWSDISDISIGDTEEDLIALEPELRKNGIAIEEAGEGAKEILGKNNLLEIYAVIKDRNGQIIGFIECYFDSSDIAAFVNKTHVAIIGSIITGILLIVFFLRVILRRQDDIIVRQAYELSSLVDQSPLGIYTVDINGKILSINHKMLEILEETSPENIFDKKVWDIKSIMAANIEGLLRGVLTGVPFNKEIKVTRRDASESYLHYRGTPILGSDGKTVEQALFIVEDITEHKNLEKREEEHTKELEEGVAKRTKELQDKIDELEQFQKLTIGREIRMTELKQEMETMEKKITDLEARASQ